MRVKSIFIWTGLLGGLIFWLPTIVLHAVEREDFSGGDVLVLTALLPVMAVVAAVVAQLAQGRAREELGSPSMAVLLGVWVLGPLAMSVSETFAGGGFATQDWWIAVPVLMALFPITTFMMAAYDGSLFGLLLGSALLFLLFLWSLVRSSGGPANPHVSRT